MTAHGSTAANTIAMTLRLSECATALIAVCLFPRRVSSFFALAALLEVAKGCAVHCESTDRVAILSVRPLIHLTPCRIYCVSLPAPFFPALSAPAGLSPSPSLLPCRCHPLRLRPHPLRYASPWPSVALSSRLALAQRRSWAELLDRSSSPWMINSLCGSMRSLKSEIASSKRQSSSPTASVSESNHIATSDFDRSDQTHPTISYPASGAAGRIWAGDLVGGELLQEWMSSAAVGDGRRCWPGVAVVGDHGREAGSWCDGSSGGRGVLDSSAGRDGAGRGERDGAGRQPCRPNRRWWSTVLGAPMVHGNSYTCNMKIVI
ncbi:hypothetical protein ACLOJK_016977 [Asimina triloba]